MAPLVLVWDAGRWLLFGMFSLAERLDPFGPLAELIRRVVPRLMELLMRLRPFFERIIARIEAVVVWCARPLIWLVDRLVPIVKAVVRRLALAWAKAVEVSRPVRRRTVLAYRWVRVRMLPIWRWLTRPIRQAWRTTADALVRVLGRARAIIGRRS